VEAIPSIEDISPLSTPRMNSEMESNGINTCTSSGGSASTASGASITSNDAVGERAVAALSRTPDANVEVVNTASHCGACEKDTDSSSGTSSAFAPDLHPTVSTANSLTMKHVRVLW